MTAADRPSVTDNARDEAAAALRSTVDLDPRSDFDRGYAHGWHAAAEWAADRAETTTVTTDEAVGELLERMSDAVTRLEALRAEHWDAPERQRLHGKVEGVKLAASYVEEARGLLATARTHPTRYEVARAIRLSRTNGLCKPGVRCDLCDCAQEYEDDLALRDADAVLALYADQPTEAEAGARALEQAAEWLRSDMDEPWGDRAANRLDVRAARIRAGGA